MGRMACCALVSSAFLLPGCMHQDVAIRVGEEHWQLNMMTVETFVRQRPSGDWAVAAKKTRFQRENPELCVEEGEDIACLASASFRSGYFRPGDYRRYRGFAAVQNGARCTVNDGDGKRGELDDKVTVQVHTKNKQAVKLELPFADLRSRSRDNKAAAMLSLCRSAVSMMNRQEAG